MAVTVLPITRRCPADPRLALEIPSATKARRGLDVEQSWVVLSDASRFVWPGPGLRPWRAGDGSTVACGFLPGRLMEEIRLRLVALAKARRVGIVPRSG